MRGLVFSFFMVALLVGVARASDGTLTVSSDLEKKIYTKIETMYEKIDVDQNGSITEAEYAVYWTNKFNTTDVDGDNILSQDEVKAYAKNKVTSEKMKDTGQ